MANISNQGAASQVAFGQYGSAFHDTDSNVITPPEGLVIVAIAFLADSSFDTLVAEDPGKVFNFASAANDGGQFERSVNQGTGSTNKIIFDDTNAASGVKIGDKVFQTIFILCCIVFNHLRSYAHPVETALKVKQFGFFFF